MYTSSTLKPERGTLWDHPSFAQATRSPALFSSASKKPSLATLKLTPLARRILGEPASRQDTMDLRAVARPRTSAAHETSARPVDRPVRRGTDRAARVRRRARLDARDGLEGVFFVGVVLLPRSHRREFSCIFSCGMRQAHGNYVAGYLTSPPFPRAFPPICEFVRIILVGRCASVFTDR